MLRIDPHIHLGGVISIDFVWKTIIERNWKHLAETYEDVQAAMQFAVGEPYGFYRFLDKFKILNHIIWNEELIDESIKSVCNYLEINRIDYAWMRFSINKYMDTMTWHKKDAIQFLYESFRRHRPGKVGLILSLKYESMRASQRQYARLINDPDIARYLIGLDLVGDEALFDAEFYRPIFDDWAKANKILCAHVGESQSVRNVSQAFIELGVRHIAHGVKIVTQPDTMRLAKEYGICFDMAITSNYLTGVCDKYTHPIKQMVDFGLNVTIGTDDPVQCNTNLDKEYDELRNLELTSKQCADIAQRAVDNTIRYGLL